MKKKPISSVVKICGLFLLPSSVGFGCNPPKPELDYSGNPPAPMEPVEAADTADSGDTEEEADTEDTAEESGDTGEE